MLAHLAGAALVLAHEDEQKQATELSAFASTHPARTRACLERLPLYVSLRGELEENLPPDTFARTWERGQELDPLAVADEALAALEQMGAAT